VNPEISVLPDLPALGAATGERLVGPVVAISGGSTFESLFPFWAAGAMRRQGSSRSPAIEFIPVDERRVGLSEPGSNWAVAIRLLLDPAGLSAQALHWTPTAAHLDRLVRGLVPAGEGRIPSIPQVWLGMGDDGHTASLFPGGPELDDLSSLALETTAPKAPHPRVTLGLEVLRSADDLAVVVTGPAKAGVLRRVLDGDRTLPLARVLAGRKSAIFVDAPCARAAGL
jgi:6-phosphogluconolactonase